jgi:hypothetical protein
MMTDLDVYAAVPDDFIGFRHVVFDCKTLSRESPVNRALWLRGVLDRMAAHQAICVLKKSAMEPDHKLLATDLNVVLLAEDEFDLFAKATSTQYDLTTAHVADGNAWDALFQVAERYSSLRPAIEFFRSTYWMPAHPGEVCRRCVAAIREVRGELDPAKSEHVAIALDFAALFARVLAILTAHLFKAYLHPRNQHELEDGVRVLLYGGRDSYEKLNKMYRIAKEKGGETAAIDLSLPEWSRFVKLVRQLLDAPTQAPQAALIIRELAFARLMGSSRLDFVKALCKESPQGARFAVLITGYFFQAAGLPAQFLEDVEPALLSLL